MRKIVIPLLILLLVSSFGYSQTVVKLLLPTNCPKSISSVITQEENVQALTIIPNPCDGNFVLSISLPSAINVAIIQIFNLLGEQVYTDEVYCTSNKLIKQYTLKELKTGTYLVHVKNGTTDYTTKLLIK